MMGSRKEPSLGASEVEAMVEEAEEPEPSAIVESAAPSVEVDAPPARHVDSRLARAAELLAAGNNVAAAEQYTAALVAEPWTER